MRGEITPLTDAGLARYDNGRRLGEALLFPSVEPVGAIVVQQRIILSYPYIRSIQGIDIKVEGEVGRQSVGFVDIHGLIPRLLLLPLIRFFMDVLAPIFGMKHGEGIFTLLPEPRSHGLLSEDM